MFRKLRRDGIEFEGQYLSHIFKDISLSIIAHFQGCIHFNNRTFSKPINVSTVIVLPIPMLPVANVADCQFRRRLKVKVNSGDSSRLELEVEDSGSGRMEE